MLNLVSKSSNLSSLDRSRVRFFPFLSHVSVWECGLFRVFGRKLLRELLLFLNFGADTCLDRIGGLFRLFLSSSGGDR